MIRSLIPHEARVERQVSWRPAWLALGVRALRALLGVGANTVHVRIKRI